MVVREIGVGARRTEFRIVRGHPFVMDADALHSEGDELSVEERPLQKPALVFDPLARGWDCVPDDGIRRSCGFRYSISLVTHLRKRLASGFRLVKTRL